MQDNLTTFFASLGYAIPWSRVTLREVTHMPITAILCRDSNAVTVAWCGRYYIDYLAGVPEAVIAHELFHTMEIERMGLLRYSVSYAFQYITVGYHNISHETSARKCAEEYFKWTHQQMQGGER